MLKITTFTESKKDGGGEQQSYRIALQNTEKSLLDPHRPHRSVEAEKPIQKKIGRNQRNQDRKIKPG